MVALRRLNNCLSEINQVKRALVKPMQSIPSHLELANPRILWSSHDGGQCFHQGDCEAIFENVWSNRGLGHGYNVRSIDSRVNASYANVTFGPRTLFETAKTK